MWEELKNNESEIEDFKNVYIEDIIEKINKMSISSKTIELFKKIMGDKYILIIRKLVTWSIIVLDRNICGDK